MIEKSKLLLKLTSLAERGYSNILMAYNTVSNTNVLNNVPFDKSTFVQSLSL